VEGVETGALGIEPGVGATLGRGSLCGAADAVGGLTTGCGVFGTVAGAGLTGLGVGAGGGVGRLVGAEFVVEWVAAAGRGATDAVGGFVGVAVTTGLGDGTGVAELTGDGPLCDGADAATGVFNLSTAEAINRWASVN
jgi:hypothetical protein